MRTIHLPLFVTTDNPADSQPQIDRLLKIALSRDEELTKGLDNLEKGCRLIAKVNAFEKSAVLILEEDEYAALVKATEKFQWGGLGFFLYPVLKKIKEAPADPEPASEKKNRR